ncbi:MAG: S41 family peptidase [Planctomycetota bacterium]|nr:S41 family peptidase [Planctomycetota bacterium]
MNTFEQKRIKTFPFESGNAQPIVPTGQKAWIFVSIMIACAIVFMVFLVSTFKTINSVKLSLLVAAPASEFVPVKKASQNFRGLIFVSEKIDDNKIHLDSFDYIWNKIKESYWEDDFGGVDWNQAREELRPKIKEAKNVEEVRGILNEMISRLGKSHYAVIPATTFKATQIARTGNADSGLSFRLSSNKILVSAVRKGSDAERKGIRAGWQITAVGSKKVSDFLEKASSFSGVMRFETLVAYQFGNTITGPVAAKRKCSFLDQDQNEQSVEIELSEPPGRTVQYGNLPSMRIDMESRLLDSNVGYFRFTGFFDPVRLMPAFRKAVKDFREADGLVIDIRGNGGGIVGMTMGMASPLTNNPAPLGVMKMKNSELKLALFKNARPYANKIAVLVDEASASASEIYAGGLQDLRIAKIFGRRTAGLSLPSTVEKLPNGDGFQYAIANYISASGKVLEGQGVTPDETITLNQANLSKEIDPTLKRAIQWIQSKEQ